MITEQMKFWNGDFGKQYTDRNIFDLEGFNQVYKDQFGLTRTELNEEFLKDLPIDNILEVGCNLGYQLLSLQSSGFKNLFGIDYQQYAVEQAKVNCKNINIIQASAFDLPFKGNYFDLVFTNGVLIHISPEDLSMAMNEMVRVSRKYIWGFEYYSQEMSEIPYRGHEGRMWKANYAQMFLNQHPNLKLIKEIKYPHIGSTNVDQMYLLEKIN